MDPKILITHSSPKSPISEAYRVLRTNIQYSGIDKALKTIVVTSSGPREGKTTTIINLAVTFAQMGSKVLLVDADLRKPRVHRMMEVSNSRGLTNIIALHDDYQNNLLQCEIENLDIITSGAIPPNPSELLNSNSMKQFVEKVREDYDIVFIDSPPICSVTDAAILSTIVDGTMLVVASGRVESDALIRAKELLNKVNANIIGAVLNMVGKSVQGNYYYYYSYYGDKDENTGGKINPNKHKKTNSGKKQRRVSLDD